MIPIGWDPRSYPPTKYGFQEDKIIWYLDVGGYYMPHDKEVVLSWDKEYINNVKESIYTARDRRLAYCQHYNIITRIFSKVSPSILQEE